MKPQLGDRVLFKMDDGVQRAAVVVRCWPEVTAYVKNECNILLYLDGKNDRDRRINKRHPTAEEIESCTVWMTSVPQGDAPGSWSFPGEPLVECADCPHFIHLHEKLSSGKWSCGCGSVCTGPKS